MYSWASATQDDGAPLRELKKEKGYYIIGGIK